MILQSLNSFYKRKIKESSDEIPGFGYSRENIEFGLIINVDGKIKDRLMMGSADERGKHIPIRVNVPSTTESSARRSNRAPYFLWDKTDYILGVNSSGKKMPDHFSDFKKLHEDICANTADTGLNAVLNFLRTWEITKTMELEYWEEIAGCNCAFILEGETAFIFQRPEAKRVWNASLMELEEKYAIHDKSKSIVRNRCLINGEGDAVIARVHRTIKGVFGAQTSGAGIINFNDPAYWSFNKEQSFNAPISIQSAFNYTTALNYLLKSKNQKVRIGDTTIVFWAEKPHAMEESLFYFFNPPGEKPEDESAEKQVIDAETTQRIRVFLECIREGRLDETAIPGDSQFYILGLSPNASRLAVRFWLQSTVSELAEKLYRYFRDLEIETQFKDELKFPKLKHLLCETAVLRKEENVNPLLGGTVMRSILSGGKYPESLLSACIGRIRAEQDNPDKHQYKINYRRISLIKTCLIRNHQKEVPVSIDKTKTDVSYLLGRLFAIFEKAQEDAAGGKLNSTIKERYFGSAMAMPRSIFPILFRLNNHHVSKGEYGGYYTKLVAEVVDMLNADNTPAHLPLEEQGLFAIGYYHQRNDLFRAHKKD